ncbi:MAG: 2Fe-2S iron-sulfur cluster-binding protein [Thermoplasmatota archaeon]
MTTLEINVNGKNIKAEEGETILSACERNDIEIPTLCHHKALEDVMACRLCLVEINGERLSPSCGTKVEEGMEIKTNTDDIKKHRKMILELIYESENHFCMFCESDGDCELQDLMWEHEIDRFEFPRSYPDQPIDSSHDFIVIDNNRCIRCGRCVRACSEVVGNDTLDFGGRGLDNEIVADTNVSLDESTCISCGMCLQVCPTGAIFNKQSMFKGTLNECDSDATTCMRCSMGCGTDIYTRSNNVIEIMGSDTEEESGGQLCEKGRFKPILDRRDRITDITIKEDGTKKKMTLEEGIEKVKAKLEEAEVINGLTTGKLPSETLEAFKECMKSHDAYFEVHGAKRYRIEKEVMRRLNMISGHLIDDITEVMNADHILVYDTSIVDTHPVLASYIRRASKNGTRLMTVDSGEDNFWRYSDISINVNSPKTQLTRLVNEVIKEGVESINDLSRVSSILGGVKVHPEDIMKIVNHLEEDTYDIIIIGSETPDRWSIRNIFELAKLEGSYIISLNPVANQHFKNMHTEDLHDESEVTYMFVGEDDKNIDELVEEAENTDYLIVQAARESKLTEMADIVIPSTTYFETEGTFVDINDEKKTVNKVFKPKMEADSDVEILKGIDSRRGGKYE